MAERRMFTKKITESDAFLEMPSSAQNLYFHLNMEADDDGFVNAPKKIMRIVGASEDDMKLLILKKFVLLFENGVIVIKHWRMHNLLRHDRYHPTQYQDEYKSLSLDEESIYHRITMETNEEEPQIPWQPNGNQMATEVRLGKDSIGKVNKELFAPSSDESDAVARIPLNINGTYHYIFQADIDHYKELYPAVDVEQEIRAMVGWCEANPNNRKTKGGVKRFINNWLNKSQNRTRAYSERNKSGVTYIDIK